MKFQVGWVSQTQTLPFKLGETGSSFGGTFGGEWKTSRDLPSLKIWKRSDKKWGRYRGPKWGSKFLITPALSSMGKTLEAENENVYFGMSISIPILHNGKPNQWDALTLANF